MFAAARHLFFGILLRDSKKYLCCVPFDIRAWGTVGTLHKIKFAEFFFWNRIKVSMQSTLLLLLLSSRLIILPQFFFKQADFKHERLPQCSQLNSILLWYVYCIWDNNWILYCCTMQPAFILSELNVRWKFRLRGNPLRKHPFEKIAGFNIHCWTRKTLLIMEKEPRVKSTSHSFHQTN